MLDETLRRRLEDAAARAFAGHSIAAAYAHGSRVSGRARPASDLDIAYCLTSRAEAAPLPLRDELAIAGTIAEAIGLDVDLRSLRDAPLEFRGRVLEDGCRIYEGDPVERVTLERDTLSRYHDYEFEFAAMHELRLKSLASRAG